MNSITLSSMYSSGSGADGNNSNANIGVSIQDANWVNNALFQRVNPDDWVSVSSLGIAAGIFHRMLEQTANAISAFPFAIPPGPVNHESSPEQQKNHAAIALLDEWLSEPGEYDEKAWPILKKSIDENRLSTRHRFSE